MDDSTNSKMTEDNFTEDNSTINESTASNKRKRIRKRKPKKPAEAVPESDVSVVESSGKKPKIIDSILISSGKHIRFKGLDNEGNASDVSTTMNENNSQRVVQNGDGKSKHFGNTDLSALLNLRQSSTPLTFAHKRQKRDYKVEPMDEAGMSVQDTSVLSNKSNKSLDLSKSTVEVERTKESSQLSKSVTEHDNTVSFKVILKFIFFSCISYL